jgi:hypothetical protein
MVLLLLLLQLVLFILLLSLTTTHRIANFAEFGKGRTTPNVTTI